MDSLTKIARKTFFLIFMKWAWTRRPQDLQIQSLLVGIEMGHDSWNNHPSRYYYFEKYDADYIAGLACSRHDIGSFELTQKSFYKLLEYFMKEYISCCITSSR